MAEVMFKKEVTDTQKEQFKAAMQVMIDIKSNSDYYNGDLNIEKSKVAGMFSDSFNTIFTSLINATDKFKKDNRALIETIVKQYADFENPEVGDEVCSQIIDSVISLKDKCDWAEKRAMKKNMEKSSEIDYTPFAIGLFLGIMLGLSGLVILIATFPAPALPLLIGALALEGAAIGSLIGGTMHYKSQVAKEEEAAKIKEVAATTNKDMAKDLEKAPAPTIRTNFAEIEAEKAAKKANSPEGPSFP